ncbi:hypothetical protein CABS01_13359 [Colletotrichum abscissum]|uniref:Uncharacterized protein n=1 Tax=Colletotrichum tamarilloi TaxID=1209934 RepID=A0ABQ9QP02_9PEZI|nr:hypothetical protein CTAM01_14520 [Colletotrichum tamarilloi]KAK1486142.1 hypothetical protein CABS01_13359 [Colletotrichum abscissum]
MLHCFRNTYSTSLFTHRSLPQ